MKIKNVLSTLAIVACVGAVAWTTDQVTGRHVSDGIINLFNKEEKIEEDTRVGLVKINLVTDVGGSLMNENIVSYFNDSIVVGKKDIFNSCSMRNIYNEETESYYQETYTPESVYKDNGGLKFGSSSKLGTFSIDLIDDYSFNRCNIVGRNYSALNNQTLIYSCDKTSISVNDKPMQSFGTNETDNNLIAPTEVKKYSFDEMQSYLKITTEGKRCTIFSIELWTE